MSFCLWLSFWIWGHIIEKKKRRSLSRCPPRSDPLNQTLTFLDGTPDYMHIPSAACRIRSAFPKARLIMLLRDPVARALSHWNMGLLYGKKVPFSDVVSSSTSLFCRPPCVASVQKFSLLLLCSTHRSRRR